MLRHELLHHLAAGEEEAWRQLQHDTLALGVKILILGVKEDADAKPRTLAYVIEFTFSSSASPCDLDGSTLLSIRNPILVRLFADLLHSLPKSQGIMNDNGTRTSRDVTAGWSRP